MPTWQPWEEEEERALEFSFPTADSTTYVYVMRNKGGGGGGFPANRVMYSVLLILLFGVFLDSFFLLGKNGCCLILTRKDVVSRISVKDGGGATFSMPG